MFGHFGDRVGRKSTLVASLLTMGLSTVAIGCLPGYRSIGLSAPIVLVALRFLQGLGLGGEWGGAALLAAEYAPGHRRGWYSLFPQIGPSIGFFAAGGAFLLLSLGLDDATFRAWAWRVPFLVFAYNFGGVIGGALAPTIATWLIATRGASAMGYYLGGAALVSLVSIALLPETRGARLVS